jgi:RNA polymerase sigma factor (TIGR02999 family)
MVGADASAQWDHRGHFFAAAAEAMRRILVENARKKRRQKRGGRLVRMEFDSVDLAAPQVADHLLALDEALDKLTTVDEQAAKLVQLRFFAGLSIPQIAESLGVSPRTADRLWVYARAFLHEQIYED